MIVLCGMIAYLMVIRKRSAKRLTYAAILFCAGGIIASGAELLFGLGTISNKPLVDWSRTVGMALFAVAMLWIARVSRARPQQ
jgi:hypothetical protein